jgi:hypothetical protein
LVPHSSWSNYWPCWPAGKCACQASSQAPAPDSSAAGADSEDRPTSCSSRAAELAVEETGSVASALALAAGIFESAAGAHADG